MSTEKLIPNGAVQSESFRQCGEHMTIFEELPVATIVSVSRPDTGDISPMLLSYTIEFQYKQARVNFKSLEKLVIYCSRLVFEFGNFLLCNK